VLRALAEPTTMAEVADALFLSPNTLKTHARRVYRALGASNRADAVDAARRAGLL
jgi:LuxR family maltose regulon positive regulatory protein